MIVLLKHRVPGLALFAVSALPAVFGTAEPARGQAAIKKEYSRNQFTVIPKDGDKVTAGYAEFTWHALDTSNLNVNLYHFACDLEKPTFNVVFWAVTIVNCPREMPKVRLSVGFNSASIWWVNSKKVIDLYGERQSWFLKTP